MTRCRIIALYKFVPLPDYEELRLPLLEVCNANKIMGTLLLADEGINGTIAGEATSLENVISWLKSQPRFSNLEYKESWAEENPFYRMKVRLKKEIVTLGVPGVSPTKQVGEYVKPEQWNELISDPEVVVIDTRNDYEVSIGTFKGAINPNTVSFREFPAWFRAQKNLHNKPKIAMFCTGGIRCEKSTSFLKSEGFDDVYHLDGGILKYLETVPDAESLWEGECFVFDQRVSVGLGLKVGPYDLCHACRHPITEDDKKHATYVVGVSCPNCHDKMSKEQKQRFSERQKQIDLARKRGEAHIAVDQTVQRKRKKELRKIQVERSMQQDQNSDKLAQ